ncbi:hypothetical protein C8R44DRAFT_974712 [Mycena epipterygia]|nr:hypothetical protein C8R44DRAFT_974712 [Mycena epipterygia]
MPPTRTVDARAPPEDPFDPLAATGQNVADIVMTDIDIELRRGNVNFQVLWSDGDSTWEPLSNVNNCEAMDVYLAHRNVTDPIHLSKRKYLIDVSLKASN